MSKFLSAFILLFCVIFSSHSSDYSYESNTPQSELQEPEFKEPTYKTNSAPEPVSYKCELESECLSQLKTRFLKKESDESFYKICHEGLSIYKNCCSDPASCNYDFAKGIYQPIEQNSLGLVKESGSDFQNCKMNNLMSLSSLMLSSQEEICRVGIENCETECENELLHFKKVFKECFKISSPHTIDSVLKESKKDSSNSKCWNEIKNISKKYKELSINQASSFKKDIKPKDIVNCGSIKKEQNSHNLNKLALNVCERAKAQYERERGAETSRE